MNISRRNLMRALGMVGPAYFLPSLRRKQARAADPSIPTRILFFYTPHGTLLRQWVQAAAGASAPTETSFQFGPILQPLSALQSKALILEGMDFQSEYVDPIGAVNGHGAGQTHALTGINRANPSAAGGISIDQFIAHGINSPTSVTSLPSLEMSARANAATTPFWTSWAGSNSLIPPMTDPTAVYNRLFPNGPPSSQPASSPAQDASAALARRRKSVLDGVLAEMSAVNQPLSTADRQKLDSHASLIRALEMQQALPSTPAPTCSAPTQSAVTTAYHSDCPKGYGSVCIQDSAAAFTSLAVAAFACDITRVITLDVDTLPDSVFASNPAVATAGGMHPFLHGMDDLNWFQNDRYGSKNNVTATAQDPTNLQTAIKFFASYAQILANLAHQLDAVPEPDGSTLLDHTIILWCGELGTTNHTYFWLNYLLLGGGAAGIKTGRYVKMPRTKPGRNANDFFVDSGIPHNNLFVSLAQAMGLSNVTTFGNPSVCTGPISQLHG